MELKSKQRIRALLDNTNEAEQALWLALQKCHLRDYHFRRQAVIEPYLVDFLCVELKLVIQLKCRSTDVISPIDQQKQQFLQSHGYRTLCFWQHEVLSNLLGVVNSLIPTLTRRGLELDVLAPLTSDKEE